MKSLREIETQVGHADWEDHEHFGYRVYRDLAGRTSHTELLALGVTGRKLDGEQIAMLDDMSACMCITEPRIWPLKAARIVSSYGRVIPGVMAGMLCVDSDLIGPWTVDGAVAVLHEVADEVGQEPEQGAIDAVVARLLQRSQRLIGFGVPGRPRDERVLALRRCITRRGRADCYYWSLGEKLWGAIRSMRGLEPNISSGLAAAGLDLGLTADELAPLMVGLMQNVFWANAVEGAQQRAAVLEELPVEHLRYVGAPPRVSPRAWAESDVEAR